MSRKLIIGSRQEGGFMKKSKILYDKKSDNLYLFIQGGELEEYREIVPGVGVEFDKKGKLLGIEILDASKILGVVPKIKERFISQAIPSNFKQFNV